MFQLMASCSCFVSSPNKEGDNHIVPGVAESILTDKVTGLSCNMYTGYGTESTLVIVVGGGHVVQIGHVGQVILCVVPQDINNKDSRSILLMVLLLFFLI